MIALLFLGSILVLQASPTDHAAHKCKTPCKTKVVKCPVSGKVIAKDAMNIKSEYKGKTYYFCCEDCKAKFDKDPEKYVKAHKCKTVYTCPMEKCDYKSDKPGKCPKCGMELKKKACTCKVHKHEGSHMKKEKKEDK